MGHSFFVSEGAKIFTSTLIFIVNPMETLQNYFGIGMYLHYSAQLIKQSLLPNTL